MCLRIGEKCEWEDYDDRVSQTQYALVCMEALCPDSFLCSDWLVVETFITTKLLLLWFGSYVLVYGADPL